MHPEEIAEAELEISGALTRREYGKDSPIHAFDGVGKLGFLPPKSSADPHLVESIIASLQTHWDVLSTQGGLWWYNEGRKIWEEIERPDLITLIGRLAGCRTLEGKRIKIHRNQILAIYSLLLDHTYIREDDFFAHTPSGVVCAGRFVSVSERGVQIIPAEAEHRARFCVDFPYQEGIDTTPWERFICSVFEEDTDTQEKAQLLQEFFGACLTGRACDYGSALVLTGSGANGKSTFLDLMSELFPPYGLTSIPPHKWAEDYHVVKLQGSILNSCNEIPAAEISASDTFKSVITGETVVAREPYKGAVSFRPTAGHVFACNELPYVKDHSVGFWRRFLTIPFNRDFRSEGRTKEEVLCELRPMLPQVLKWVLMGAHRILKRKKYIIPRSHKDLMAEWQTDTNSVKMWLEVCNFVNCTKGVRSQELYQAYSGWARQFGYHPLNLSTFGKRLTGAGVGKIRRKTGVYYLVKPKSVQG